MRTFYFKARNIGQEKYLTYTMGEGCELDEDVLEYYEENKPEELIDIIYEEDDDYDYLTYDITEKISLADYIKDEVNCEQVLFLLRNIANGLISLKEQTIHLSYILMNREFVYLSETGLDVRFICVPVESKAQVAVEFKAFVRELLAHMKYDVDEDLGYVGKLLTYINSDNFNLRGLIGLSEALMEEVGIVHETAVDTSEDGVEIVNSLPEEEEENSDSKVADFMSSIGDDAPLPEIGDDEEDEDEVEEEMPLPKAEDKAASEENNSAQEGLPRTEESVAFDVAQEAAAEPVADAEVQPQKAPEPVVPVRPKKELDIDILKNRMQDIVADADKLAAVQEKTAIKTSEELDNFLESRPPVLKKSVVKVNRAAIIQSAAEHEEEKNDSLPAANDQAESQPVKKPDPAPQKQTVTVIRATPYLVRVNTDERIMLSKLTFKIGKASVGVDYSVGGNKAISRQHAVIIQRDGMCFIKDNKSANHTYVNDKLVEDGVEEPLSHDAIIRLADEEFRFKIR